MRESKINSQVLKANSCEIAMSHASRIGLSSLGKEMWKDIQGYDGLYQISDLGRVKSFAREKMVIILKQHPNQDGYLRVKFKRKGVAKSFSVSRLVASAFIKNPKEQVNHINCIKHDNRVSNLEWVSRQRNMDHAYENDLVPLINGERNGKSKLTEKQVLEIRAIGKKLNSRQIGRLYDVRHYTVECILQRITWKHI